MREVARGPPTAEPEFNEGAEMIVVVGRVRTDADRRDGLVRVGQAVAAASRAEQGCISYRLYEDSEIENDFVFVEEWEDNEALERHFATPDIREFMQAIPATIVAPPDVNFHTIASSRTLADVGAG
jgi:quinol monooxygenase YgiN